MKEENIQFDYSMLEGKIKQYFDTQEKFAEVVPMARSSLNQKLQNKGSFSDRNIYRMCELLEIPIERSHEYFFKLKV